MLGQESILFNVQAPNWLAPFSLLLARLADCFLRCTPIILVAEVRTDWYFEEFELTSADGEVSWFVSWNYLNESELIPKWTAIRVHRHVSRIQHRRDKSLEGLRWAIQGFGKYPEIALWTLLDADWTDAL